jgi:cell division septum initiation protein DivIVA
MRLTPVEGQHVTVRRRLLGYDRGAVDRLLEDAASSYEEVWHECDGLRAELERVRGELERSRENERLVSQVLVRAQKIAETTIADARSTAVALVSHARKEADKLMQEARAEPERVRREIGRLQAVESGLRARLREFLAAAQKVVEGSQDDLAPLGQLDVPAAAAASGAADGANPLG